MITQCEQCAPLVLSPYQHRQIIVAPPIGDHSHGDLAEGIEDLSLKSHILPLEVTDDAYDRQVVLLLDRPQLA